MIGRVITALVAAVSLSGAIGGVFGDNVTICPDADVARSVVETKVVAARKDGNDVTPFGDRSAYLITDKDSFSIIMQNGKAVIVTP